MVKIHVSVDIVGRKDSLLLTLPCKNLDTILSGVKDGEYQIVDWDEGFQNEEDFSDIYQLNAALNKINIAIPEIETELLAQILLETNNSLTDTRFLEKLCKKDFILDEVKPRLDETYYNAEEQCAHYLVSELGVPFAQDITDSDLVEILSEDSGCIFWDVIWSHYYHMGFVSVVVNEKIYVSHWG